MIASRQADTVLIPAGGAAMYTDRRATAPWTRPANELVVGYGLFTAAEFALMARRHMIVHGTTPEQLATLTAKAAEIDRVLGLELDADDYVTKPFSPRELVLRVKKILQRGDSSGEKHETMRFGDLLIDLPKHLVSWKGKSIELTATEFKLVTVLAERAGRVQTRDALLRDVWEYDAAIDTRTVDTHMRRLREKLGPAAKHLDTVRGVGYRFIES
jgi:DNA-binding response OmpR family regulator